MARLRRSLDLVPRLARLACLCLWPSYYMMGCASGSAPTSRPGDPDMAASAPDDRLPEQRRPTPETADSDPAPAPPVVRRVSLAEVGLDAQAMDASADACVDFYQYACGGLIARTAVPAGRERYSRIDELEQQTLERIRALLEAGAAKDPLAQVYRQCMDSAAVERADLAGVEDLLSAIRGMKRREQLGPVLAALHGHGVWAGFKLGVERTISKRDSDRSRAILVLEDGDLGLPTRQHYLASGAASERLRRGYREHVQTVFALAGWSRREAEKAGKEVLRIETELARVAETSVAERRVDGWYQEVERAHLRDIAGALDWPAYLDALGWPKDAPIAVVSDEYLARMNALVRGHGPKGFARLLEWRLLDQLTSALPPAFLTEKLAFQARLHDREPVAPPRWRQCVAAVDQAFGDGLARAYADAHFAKTSERRAAVLLIDALRRALVERVAERSWLGEHGKAAARAKLQALVTALGDEPDAGESGPGTGAGADTDADAANHDALVQPTFGATILAARARAVRRQFARVDSAPSSPRLFAHRVDGFYDPRGNRLALAAALLVPPFFAASRPSAVNLGALATIAGHQLIHVVDDLGQGFGAAGLAWQAADERGYRDQARCLSKAYDGAHPAERPPLIRTRDLREDIADLGGLAIGYRALQEALSKADAGERLMAGGLDEARLFFLAAAQASCQVERADTGQSVTRRASARTRLNRTLAQLPGFADAFQCPGRAPMRALKQDICDIW